MARCDYCGESVDHSFTCNHCGQTHCSEHRLPEKHECVFFNPSTERVFESDGPNIRERGTGQSRVTGRQPEKKDTSRSKNHCEGCERVISPTESRCAQCRPSTPTPETKSTDQKKDKKQCRECNNYTTSDHDLCLDCRYEPDTKSPDLNPDGTLQNEGTTGSDNTEQNPSNLQSLLTYVELTALNAVAVVLYLLIVVWSAGHTPNQESYSMFIIEVGLGLLVIVTLLTGIYTGGKLLASKKSS